MAGFLYYIPGGDQSISIERLGELGLGHAFEKAGGVTVSGVRNNGPDGGAGVIVADPRRVPDARVGCYRDQQTWERYAGDYCLGFYTKERPGPHDLARPKALGGRPVELADGNPWLVPVVQMWSDDEQDEGFRCALPSRLELDWTTGKWEPTGVAPAYREVLDGCLRWWDQRQKALFGAADAQGEDLDDDEVIQAEVEISFSEAADLAVQLLSLNYAIGRAEVSMLGLFDTERVRQILDAAVDVDFFLESLKKKVRASIDEASSSADGPQVGTEPTAPP